MIECVGVVAAKKAFGIVDFDALGIVAAVAVGLTAWARARQYQTFNRAYFVASQELATISSQVGLAGASTNGPASWTGWGKRSPASTNSGGHHASDD